MSQSIQTNSGGMNAHDDADTNFAQAELAQLQERLDGLRRELAVADRRLRVAARQNPLMALGIAVGVGYLLGRVLKRI